MCIVFWLSIAVLFVLLFGCCVVVFVWLLFDVLMVRTCSIVSLMFACCALVFVRVARVVVCSVCALLFLFRLCLTCCLCISVRLADLLFDFRVLCFGV